MSAVGQVNIPVTGTDIVIGTGGLSAVIGHFAGYVPGIVATIASAFTAIYFILQIMKDPVILNWIGRRREFKKVRQIARLQARQQVLTAELEAVELRKRGLAAAAQLIHSAEVAAVQKLETAKTEAAVTKVTAEAAIKKVSE